MNDSSIFGMDVAVSPDRPKYQLPSDVTVPQAFREDFDRWALGFFGTTNRLEDGQVIVLAGRRFVMNPRTYLHFKGAVKCEGLPT